MFDKMAQQLDLQTLGKGQKDFNTIGQKDGLDLYDPNRKVVKKKKITEQISYNNSYKNLQHSILEDDDVEDDNMDRESEAEH
jgi:spore cortex formation protein SpoVR/YcgB (stage V sporulation)